MAATTTNKPAVPDRATFFTRNIYKSGSTFRKDTEKSGKEGKKMSRAGKLTERLNERSQK